MVTIETTRAVILTTNEMTEMIMTRGAKKSCMAIVIAIDDILRENCASKWMNMTLMEGRILQKGNEAEEEENSVLLTETNTPIPARVGY